MNSQLISKKKSSDTNIFDLVKKYLNLLWDKKYWILLICFSMSIFWFLFSSMFLETIPEYTASAIVKFDDPRYNRDVAAVTDFGQMDVAGKIAILTTRSLLSKVVDSLNLDIQMVTTGISQRDLFKAIEIEEASKHGEYRLAKENGKLLVYYTNNSLKIENELIHSQKLQTDSLIDIEFHEMKFKLNNKIIQEFNEINFIHKTERSAYNRLKNHIKTQLDRSRTILTIYYMDNNPKHTAFVTNTLARMFVDQLLGYKKYRTSSVITSLEEQLVAARSELEKSEKTLRNFREQNPFLLLSNAGANLVAELSSQQTELQTVELSVESLTNLIGQTKGVDIDKSRLNYLELLSFLEMADVGGAQVFGDQFRDLVDQRNQLITQNYSDQHPQIMGIQQRIQELQREIDNRATQYLNQLIKRQEELSSTVGRNQRNLRRLPRGELRLAELQRDREVKADIYSNILVRFNEAKVSDASIIPDAFLIEEAQIPFEYSNMMGKLINLIIGPILGLMLGIGLFVMLDYFDNSVRDAKEVEEKLSLPVLAVLPVIGDEKEIPDILDVNKKLDAKLITSDYAPSIAGESFRVLRTKLFMDNQSDSESFIVASLSPSEGKSLVSANLAITFAQQKMPTLLVDCDLRRGVLHNTFASDKKPGLSDILITNSPLNFEDASKMIQKTHIPRLFLLSGGTQVPNPSELLGSARMKQLHNILKNEFKVILFDTPPIEFIADAFVLNNFVHNILLVSRYGKTNLNKLSDKLTEFSNVKKDFLGVIINSSQEVIQKKYYSYSYYQY